jgi:hypothetical protein
LRHRLPLPDAAVNGQWAMVNGQRTMVNNQWSMVKGGGWRIWGGLGSG